MIHSASPLSRQAVKICFVLVILKVGWTDERTETTTGDRYVVGLVDQREAYRKQELLRVAHDWSCFSPVSLILSWDNPRVFLYTFTTISNKTNIHLSDFSSFSKDRRTEKKKRHEKPPLLKLYSALKKADRKTNSYPALIQTFDTPNLLRISGH